MDKRIVKRLIAAQLLTVALVCGVGYAAWWKTAAIDAGISNLVKPKPIVSPGVWRQDGGSPHYRRDVTVSSPIVLEGLTIRIRIPGMEDVRLLSANDREPKASIKKSPDGWITIYIQHPFGTYRVEALPAPETSVWFARDVEFEARF